MGGSAGQRLTWGAGAVLKGAGVGDPFGYNQWSPTFTSPERPAELVTYRWPVPNPEKL